MKTKEEEAKKQIWAAAITYFVKAVGFQQTISCQIGHVMLQLNYWWRNGEQRQSVFPSIFISN